MWRQRGVAGVVDPGPASARPAATWLLVGLLALVVGVRAAQPNVLGGLTAKLEPSRRIVYKTVGDAQLTLDVFEPAGFARSDRRAAFVSFHGGGWSGGTPRVMYPWTAHAAELGLVGISVQYRLFKPGTAPVVDCVRDARSALRYVRAHAAELGLDPDRIVANGASAGGHLAAATALFDGPDEPGEDTAVSCRPAALVLFSPVIDTSTEGYGNAKLGASWRDLSPLHHVRAGLPPTITFHGTADGTTPFKGAKLFHEAMLAAGNASELVAVAGEQHTYMFKNAARYAETVRQLDAFLVAHGFAAAK